MQLPCDESSHTGWVAATGARLLALWPAKLFGITGGMALFFVGYFWALRHPQFEVTTMPVTPVDRWIAFRPEALALYLSLWVYVSLAPALLAAWRELIAFGVASAALGATGLAIFVLWPTAVPRAAVDWSAHPAFAFLHSVDASGNACPSLHVAFAVLAACTISHVLAQFRAGPRAKAGSPRASHAREGVRS